jgi:DNA-binding IclR family transcriptional regulator
MALVQTVLLVAKTDRRPELRERIRREYLRQPALALTVSQARRLWSLESSTCRQLLDTLVAEGFLVVSESARYHRRMD